MDKKENNNKTNKNNSEKDFKRLNVTIDIDLFNRFTKTIRERRTRKTEVLRQAILNFCEVHENAT